jgi:predicted Zn-dependent peptidase
MQEDVLPNGLRRIRLSDHEQPAIEILLQAPVGHIHDPDGKEGLAELSAGLMLKGPKGCTNEEYVDAMEQVGASQVLDVGEEHTMFGLRVLSDHADDIVPRFIGMVASPLLDKKEFGRLRREMLTSLEAEYADPSALAGKHFQAELFGRANPAGRVANLRSVKRISFDDMEAFNSGFRCAGGSTVIIAGDIDPASAKSKWNAALEALPGGPAQSMPDMTDGPELSDTRVRLVNKPDSSQTTLVIGHRCIAEHHPAREALALGNYIIGGGNFSSRLMEQVRSRTGKTYGISSQIISHRHSGTFLISTTTQNHQVGDVLAAIFDVYRECTSNGVTELELEKARQFANGNLAFQLEGISNVAEKLLWLRFYGYDNSYIENHAAIIDAVRLEQVNEALKNVLASEHFVIAAVGKRTEIGAQLERFGSVRVVDFRSDP